jgi:hypothetical protein
MKLTKKYLKQLIREELEIHFAPDNLDSFDPEEAYGMGYEARGEFCEESINDSKNKEQATLKEKQSWYEEDVSPDQLGDEELLDLFRDLSQRTKGPDEQPKAHNWRLPGGGKGRAMRTFVQKKINNERVINKRRLKQLRKELRIRFGDSKWDDVTKKYLNFRKNSP